jgi:hypothetical protein
LFLSGKKDLDPLLFHKLQSRIRRNRGKVVHAHPATVIGKSSKLAHTLKIDWLHDISTSCTQCRSYESRAGPVGAASCRDCLLRGTLAEFYGAGVTLTPFIQV